ncbi:MAG: Ig-like domain-containing protein, partial [FCB group bacterium]|nr:Ig-like domain-containing protein [FCB group bacterium]
AVLAGDKPPYIFSIDSSALNFGHSYEIMGTAYDYMGNTRNTTMGMWIADSADPPTVVLPDDPADAVLHGISIPLTPTQITGGVREIQFFLDGAAEAFNTSTLSPYQVRLDTLGMTLGTHTVRAVAVDGLDQTGEDTLTFELAENKNMPTVSFGNLQDGMQVVVGQSLVVNASAEDRVGIVSVAYYLDGTKAVPIATGTEPFSIDTSTLSLGTHALFIVATNKLGITNDIADPASVLEFAVVQPPPGQPPAAPSLTSVSYPVDGKVTVVGQSVANAKIDITNTTLGLTVTTQANGGGTFTCVVGAAAGDVLRVVAYDLSQSPDPSQPTQTVVQAAPILQRIEVSPTSHTFTSFAGYVDLQVTGYYDNSTTANLTSKATFSSSATGVAGVTASGRTAPLANGTAKITATFEGKTAACEVTVHVVVLSRIEVTPSPVELAAINQTATLTVTAHYSDDSTVPAPGPVSFVSADTRIASVNSSGQVRAVAPGSTEITVYQPGADPVKVPVTVDTGADPIPTVAILSPASNSAVERGDSVLVRVRAQDTLGGVTRVALEATGAVTASDLRLVSPASLLTEQTLFFNVPNTAAIGGTIGVRVWATDTSGAPSVAATLTLRVVDKTAPAVRITAPAALAEFAPGEAVTIAVTATDRVGVTQIRYATVGGVVVTGMRPISPASASTSTTFTFTVPDDVPDPEVRIQAFARDAAGNEGQAAPVDIVVRSTDRTPPATEATAVSAPSGTNVTVTYRVTDGLDDLDHVELYFRKDGIGTFNRYTRADAGNPQGRYTPQSGATGTIAFDSTRMGGDGHYEFYTAGVDTTGNREAAPTDGAKALLPDRDATISAGTVWTDITTNTAITDIDTSYDGQNLRVSGATLTMSGHHAFKNVELRNGATLTHPETDASAEYGVDFQAWTVLIDATSGINVTARGYLGGDNSGHSSGYTQNRTEGSTFRSSGSYGGIGVGVEGTPNPIYGNLIMPADLGSGGSRGYYGERGGDGGGRVSIAAVNIATDGAIRADGGTGAGSAAGDGSGGSVYFVVSTLSGSGAISANGGKRELPGGGGRIAVHYADLSTFDTTLATALGGTASGRSSGNGTVFLYDLSQTGGDLVIDGQPGAESSYSALPIPPGYVFDNIVLRNNARVRIDGELTINDTL